MKGYHTVKFASAAKEVFYVLDLENQQSILNACEKMDQGLSPDQLGGEPIKNNVGMFAIRIGETYRLIIRSISDSPQKVQVMEILNYYFFDQYYRKK